ncbi:hypothetical protein F66182_1570 [Fusarium sp. NRRL 66182]|nr:hypothetical protein F66182_1570 [Fusarium sp. NRRL 66182]
MATPEPVHDHVSGPGLDAAPDIQTTDQGAMTAPAATAESIEEIQPHSTDEAVSPEQPDSASNKELLLAIQALEGEVQGLRKLLSDPITAQLDRRIELIHALVKEASQKPPENETAGGVSNEELEKQSDGEESDEDEEDMICEVKRVGMEEWSTEQSAPRHVIAAHYLPPSVIDVAREGKGVAKGGTERQERPHRVELASEVLVNELEDIADISLHTQAPMLLAPPYKVLIRYYEGICERLSYLEAHIPWENKKPDEKEAPESDPSAEMTPSTTETDKDIHSEPETTPSDKTPESRDEAGKPKPGDSGADDDVKLKKRKEWSTRIDHLRVLKEFIDKDLAPQLRTYERIKAGDLARISFEDLWFLFAPGDTIYLKHRGYDQLGRVYAVTGGQQRKRRGDETYNPFTGVHEGKRIEVYLNTLPVGSWAPLLVDYYTMEYDGYYLGPYDACKQITPYTGERSITDLPFYPLKFHKDEDGIVRRLTERGRKYCSSFGHKSYSGTTCPLDDRETPEEVYGDVFVDFKDYYRSIVEKYPYRSTKPRLGALKPVQPDLSECEEKVADGTYHLYDREVDQKAGDDFMSSHQSDIELVTLEPGKIAEESLRLLPHWVPAYFFRTRRYARVDIDQMKDIDKSDEARDRSFESLVIKESHRSLLIGLVRNLVVGSNSEPSPQGVGNGSTQIDIVRGKGRGLIILLHGPPGSGKTSTAETLAAYSRRPLYPITCGDLGTTPSAVEEALVEHTERAQRWGCILLLDEAVTLLICVLADTSQKRVYIEFFDLMCLANLIQLPGKGIMKSILPVVLSLLVRTAVTMPSEMESRGTGEDGKTLDPTQITYFPAANSTGTGVLVCPGGGYARTSISKEGYVPAEYLNALGIDAWVLDYTTVSNATAPIYPKPQNEALAALDYIRSEKPSVKKLGIWGFSAGGHLAATTLTNPDARLDFGILAYPVITLEGEYTHVGSRNNLIGANASVEEQRKLSAQNLVSGTTPPTFLFHTSNDGAVPVQNTYLYANAMAEHDRLAQVLVLPDGGHGLGLALTDPVRSWTPELTRFLKYSI